MTRRLLVIDDDPSMLDLLRVELGERGFDVVSKSSPEAALKTLTEEDFSVVLTDINMAGMTGVDLCREAVRLREDTPVIVMTAFASMESAVASIRAGAYDFVTKPLNHDDLVLAIERAADHRDLRDELKRMQRTVAELRPFDEIVGESAAIKAMCNLIARVADSEATVLVTGESGTGKELVARALHSRSARASGPFVAINCAAMPEPLLESELFGHTKGAFTDARTARPGLFVKATGGTLFLDEIGEMPLGMQAKLLRALQERRARPVGGDSEVPFNARIVAATNRDLEAAVENRAFREDLFYRINVVHIDVPALRERENDVLLLAHSFLQKSKLRGGEPVRGLKSAAAEMLVAYPWPGNVRELQNCIERAVALTQFDQIGVDDLPERIGQYRPPRTQGVSTVSVGTILRVDEMERRYVLQVLELLGGNKASAARALGMDRRTLYRKLDAWGNGSAAPEPGSSPAES
ncbi:MAG TPA: sigma-54 dependent transcriptional regulator [Polyangiaceae bacterium]|jgi:two-component system response regulator HydG